MMGQQCRSESLFYYFRIEDHVPESHLLRLIDQYVSFDFVREKLQAFYSDTGIIRAGSVFDQVDRRQILHGWFSFIL